MGYLVGFFAISVVIVLMTCYSEAAEQNGMDAPSKYKVAQSKTLTAVDKKQKKQRKSKKQPAFQINSAKFSRKQENLFKRKKIKELQRHLSKNLGKEILDRKKTRAQTKSRNFKPKKFKKSRSKKNRNKYSSTGSLLKKKIVGKKVPLQKKSHHAEAKYIPKLAKTKLVQQLGKISTNTIKMSSGTIEPEIEKREQSIQKIKNEIPEYEADIKLHNIRELYLKVIPDEFRAYEKCVKTGPKVIPDNWEALHPGHVPIQDPPCRNEANVAEEAFILKSKSTEEKKKQAWVNFQQFMDRETGRPKKCKQWRYGSDCI